eukprot:4513392-Prymnesium_polylepis.1
MGLAPWLCPSHHGRWPALQASWLQTLPTLQPPLPQSNRREPFIFIILFCVNGWRYTCTPVLAYKTRHPPPG